MRRRADLFATIRTEGGLLPSDALAAIAGGETGGFPGLTPADYHLDRTTRLAEVITRSWNSLLGQWASFSTSLAALPPGMGAAALTRDRWLLPLFAELGYGRLLAAKGLTVTHAWGPLPVHLLAADVDLDRRPAGGGSSPHGLTQELLNRSDDHLWGVVTNGRRLRLLRDNATMTRQAYVEFDLEAMFEGQVYADFVVLWLLLHQSRVEGDPPAQCWLERWALEASVRGTRALNDLRRGVETALVALGRGFVTHPANGALRAALESGELSTEDLYRELLRLVYRLLFLLVAEDRDLLHPPTATAAARQRYARHYALGRLRALADRRTGTTHGDLWTGLRLVTAALGSDEGQPTLGLPALGSFLWSPAACGHLDAAELDNRHLLSTVRALALVEDTRARTLRPVDYKNLGAEELGGIYESLLELHPIVAIDADEELAFRLASATGNERKLTGSYYTPTSLITCLLDSALDPVLDEKARDPDPEAALLATTVLDPACGSGHFLIAAAHRIARRLGAVRTGEPEPPPEATRAALRDVIGRCIHGIDANPMAVELCKVSLWMEALDPGRPLAFVDHHIVCGNALLGTTPALLADGIPEGAYKTLTGDVTVVANAQKKRNKTERLGGQATMAGAALAVDHHALAAALASVDALPDDTPAAIRAKEARFVEIAASADLAHATRLADAWCAAFVVRKDGRHPAITTGVLRSLAAGQADADLLVEVAALRTQYGFLHWHLAFPTVFSVPDDPGDADNPTTGWDGGFDIVLGNPPWELAQLQEQEYFAVRAPEIAAAAGAARKRMIRDLEVKDPDLHTAYLDALRHADGERQMYRLTGRFPLCGVGRVNTYAVFAEAMRTGVGPTGRSGIIVPTGIATDDTTKQFFADLVGRRTLASLYDFENQQKLFEGVDSRVKFCLLTMSGLARPVVEADFAFFARTTADLDDDGRRFTLTAEDLVLLNPNTRTCPIFRSGRDAELTKAIYRRVPVLVREGPPEENPWGVSFRQGLFNMTSDSHLFRTWQQLEADSYKEEGTSYVRGDDVYLPLYEGKMVHHFDHRWASYDDDGSISELTLQEKQEPCALAWPQSWVPAKQAEDRCHDWNEWWLVGFRDICRSTDERTVIPSVIPWAACGNKLPLLFSELGPMLVYLAASWSSFVHDYSGRQKIGGTSLNFFIAKQLPALPPGLIRSPCAWSDQSLESWLRPRVLELIHTADDTSEIAAALGWKKKPFRWDLDRRPMLRAELDACFFRLYGLERDDLDYVMDTFPIVRRKDEAAYGEYRTKRLILERYDALADAIASGCPYVTPLDPPPAHPFLVHHA